MKLSMILSEVNVVLTPITPVQCKENVKGCLIKCTVDISDGSQVRSSTVVLLLNTAASPQYCPSVKTTTYYFQVKKANGGFYKVGKDAKIAVGMVKAGNLQKDLGPRKTPKSAAGEY